MVHIYEYQSIQVMKQHFAKNSKGKKDYNKLHLNAFYKLLDHTYVELLVQKACEHNETKALNTMIDFLFLKKRNYGV